MAGPPVAKQNGSVNKKRKRSDDRKAIDSRQESVTKSSSKDQQAQILLLEKSILESRKNYNDIVKILEIARKWTHQDQPIAAVALCRVFCRLIASGSLTEGKGPSKNESTIIKWLEERIDDFRSILLEWLGDDNVSLQSTSLTLLLRLLRDEVTLGKSTKVVATRFLEIVQQLTGTSSDKDVINEYIEKYALQYDDVRLWTLQAVGTLLADTTPPAQTEKAVLILLAIVPSESESVYLESLKDRKRSVSSSIKAQMQNAQIAWSGVLRQTLSKSQRKRILEAVPNHIGPNILEPEILMDFLTDSFNLGGSAALLALSGTYYLIRQKNLDSPHFYRKLYSMLDENILDSKHRSRFFRLLETFLDSTHLPAVLVASFIKRMARLALRAPPAGIVVVVPMIYNLLQSHPTCTFMIHRNNPFEVDAQQWGDPFKPKEEDPMTTNAIESSLWEIVTLQSHYHPNVAAIAKIISQPFTKQAYNLEDFLDHSYDTVRRLLRCLAESLTQSLQMISAELVKELKKPPEVEYQIPKRIFKKNEPDSGQRDGLLVEMWDFE